MSTSSWYRLLLVVKELIPLNKDKVRLEELLKTNDEITKVSLIYYQIIIRISINKLWQI